MEGGSKLFGSTGAIVRQLNEPLHRILYVIKSRQIRPSAIVGNARAFTEADVERIVLALREIDAKREGSAPCNP
jgi:hypothetical protein